MSSATADATANADTTVNADATANEDATANAMPVLPIKHEPLKEKWKWWAWYTRETLESAISKLVQ